MNAQRSVWSPPPPTVAQKYATYFGGIIDTKPLLIRLWWTDEEMKRLAYRELEIPDGLLALFDSIINSFTNQAYSYAYIVPPLSSVTHDNIVLFLAVLDLPDAVSALYVVCAPDRVLRYGLIPLLPSPARDPSEVALAFLALDTGSWTWDGTNVWPLFNGTRQEDVFDVFTCKINTQTGVAGPVTKVFDGYSIRLGEAETSLEEYFCNVAWAATSPQEPRALFANVHRRFVYPNPSPPHWILLEDYTVEIKYLPDGPTIATISRSGLRAPVRARTIIHGTFPEGPVVMDEYMPPLPHEVDGIVYVVYQDRVAFEIPAIWIPSPPRYKTTSTGLPYDLEITGGTWPLRVSGNRATLFFRSTRIVGDASGYKDVLVEYALDSGIAVKDIVVPSVWPEWGMEHEGAILAVPYMTSNKGRLRLP
jgi:hypothetical protein